MKILATSLFAFIAMSSLLSGHEAIRKTLDGAIEYKRNNQIIPPAVREECFKAFKDYSDELFQKHQVRSNTAFPEPDRTDFFVNCVRASIVLPSQHGGWTTRSDLRLVVMDNLIAQARDAVDKKDATLDPMRIYAYFLPALRARKHDVAIEAYELLAQRDPFLAKQALMDCYWEDENMSWVEAFYRTAKMEPQADAAKKSFAEALFPKGSKKVKLTDFKAPPKAGVLVMNVNPDAVAEVEANDVIVAINGWLTLNYNQYAYQTRLDAQNPEIKLIIWRNSKYIEVAVTPPNRKLGVGMFNYEPPLGDAEQR
jgi:hypothetical protein